MQAPGLAADNYLNHLTKVTQLTKAGKEWLKQAIDPMHDLAVKPTGYPDVKIAPSVNQLIKQTFTIKKPAGLSAGNWDLQLFNLPWWTVEEFQTYSTSGNVISTFSTLEPFNLGGVTALAAPEGEAMWRADGPGTSTIVQSYGLDPIYFEGATRVTSAGFEAVNTTSKYYQQGQVAVYRQPQPNFQQKTMCYFDADSNSNIHCLGAGSYTDVRPPPATLAEAMLFAGSKQWRAADGAYCVVTFNSLEIPADGESVIDPIVWDDDVADNEASSTPRPACLPKLQAASVFHVGIGSGTFGGAYAPQLNSMSPQDMSGMFFSGLSEQTTIALSINVYLERFPGSSEPDLKTLVNPSPAYDIFAQQLYTYCLLDMPPGVPAYMNGFGDWFASVASKLGGAVSKLTGAIPHPIAQAVSAGAGVVSSVGGLFSDPPNTRVNSQQILKAEQRQDYRYQTSLPIPIPKIRDKQPTNTNRDIAQDNAIRKLKNREEALENEVAALKRRMASSGNGKKRK